MLRAIYPPFEFQIILTGVRLKILKICSVSDEKLLKQDVSAKNSVLQHGASLIGRIGSALSLGQGMKDFFLALSTRQISVGILATCRR